MRTLALISVTVALAACAGNPGDASPPAARPDEAAQSREGIGGPATAPSPAPAHAAVPLPAARDERARLEAHRTADLAAGQRQAIAGRALGASKAAESRLAMPARPGFLPPAYAPALPADRERYQAIAENPVQLVAQAPVSTFSVDVDTGSYANVRRMLNAGRLPPPDAVRVEEMINYFPYDYPRPRGEVPFAVHTEVARAPWNAQRLLLRVAIKGEDRAAETLPPVNLVFLVDVSGSMNSRDKLPLLQASLKLMVDRLRPQDRVSLVTYASGTAVVLEATPGSDKARIANAIDALRAGGSTAGASGIELAYRMARQGFIAGGINRILLATDGDFNVGITDFRQLKSMVEERRRSGVSLSTLGFGTGNTNEHLMEQLADAGDGAYSYIDNLMEGQKVLATEMTSTLATIAQDVKVQVEFNPARVSEYRLIGYENRMLRREDFNNDRVDAGDIGAGHTVTAIYELTPVGAPGQVDPLRYGNANPVKAGDASGPAKRDLTGAPGSAAGDAAGADRSARADGELAYVKLRYKRPGEAASRLVEQPVAAGAFGDVAAASNEFRFATAIAGFGQVLRGGRYTGQWDIADARTLAAASTGRDRFGYRAEALRLMDLAGALRTRTPPPAGRPAPARE